jgi:uncharacterized protein YdaL
MYVKQKYGWLLIAMLGAAVISAVLIGPMQNILAEKGLPDRGASKVTAPRRPIATSVTPGESVKLERSEHGHHGRGKHGHQNSSLTDTDNTTAVASATSSVFGGSRFLMLSSFLGAIKAALEPPMAPAAGQAVAAPAGAVNALILYDAPPSNNYTNLGLAYAIMLRNLLGHFSATVDLVPIQNYTAGKLANYKATFYLGSYYDNSVPAAFLSDVSQTTNTVVWFKYNIWQLAWNPNYNFNTHFGFAFNGLAGMDAQPTAQNPNPGFYDTVSYKSMSMVKYYAFDATTNTISADPDLGLTSVIDSTKAQSLVTISDSHNSAQTPYVMRSGNFWYVADMPFSYIGPRDRYLAICDLLHDMLGVNHAASKRALVRLEDVNATSETTTMKSLTDYLKSKSIPFSIATIPFYRDPLGRYNGGVSEEIHMANATDLKTSLNYALARGGKILMHGYTHQYDSTPNLYTAVSADDFEFWNAVNNTPVVEDSTAWAKGRLTSGIAELKGSGYTPFAWEAPHYQSSPLSIKAVPSLFAKTYQRVVYYTSDTPNLSPGPTADFSTGQFYPYIINTDYYGQKVLPENLGNVEYNICSIDPFSCTTYTWQDIYTNAQYATVVRDGFASFFFHPFWLESDIGTPGLADFQSLIQGISGLGYTWADASTIQ